MPTVTLSATQDVLVHAQYPGTNYESYTQLYSGLNSSGYELRVLVQWDLSSIPLGAKIQTAVLKVYNTASSGDAGNYVDIRPDRNDNAWSASTVTWDTRPATVNDGNPAVRRTSATPTSEWITYDVTATVKQWVERAAANYGLSLIVALYFGWVYLTHYAREAGASFAPQLEITYTTAPRFFVNIGGVWKPAAGVFVNIGGVWKSAPDAWVNIGGVWKKS